MKQQFTSKNSADFKQRYEDTFGFFTRPGTNDKRIVKFLEVNEELVSFVDQKGISYTVYPDSDVEFTFLSPVKKLFAVDDLVFLIQRRPARQYQRGISENNTQIINLLTFGNSQPTFGRLEAAFEKEPTPKLFEQDFQLGKRRTILFSNIFAGVETKFFLYNSVIGKISDKTITLDDDIYIQEVKDMIRDTGVDYKVTL